MGEERKKKNIGCTIANISDLQLFTWEVVYNLEEEEHSYRQPTHHPGVCLPRLEVLFCTQENFFFLYSSSKSEQKTIGL